MVGTEKNVFAMVWSRPGAGIASAESTAVDQELAFLIELPLGSTGLGLMIR